MAPAGKEPGPPDFLARAHPILGPGGTGAHSHGCTSSRTRAQMVGSAYGVRCPWWTVSSLEGPFLCPRAQPGHGRDPAVGCAQSRGPEEMAPLFTTHPTGIRGHCDKGHKACGLPMNKHPTHPPPPTSSHTPPCGCWAGPTAQGFEGLSVGGRNPGSELGSGPPAGGPGQSSCRS